MSGCDPGREHADVVRIARIDYMSLGI